MKIVLNEDKICVLKFEKGEEVMAALKKFCEEERIDAGFFVGIGTCSYLKLARYDFATQNYVTKEFNEELEIANVTGDTSLADGEVVVHMHGTFGNKNFDSLSGHVLAAIISATCELSLTKFEGKMERKLDPEIGIKLLQ